jgi:16S rRNA (adenine1518-N6/adenine1519-N6)-dimethyltransferase
MAKAVKLGQNFLVDKNIARKIVGEFLPQIAGGDMPDPASRSLGTGGPVLEIGAGPGILSEMLLEAIPAERLTLVEIDPYLVRNLRQRLGDRVRILEKNILDIDLAGLFQGRKVAVIGNLPYHISKELVDWFIAQRAEIETAVLMLQKDFIDKLLSAGGKKYNAQSVVFSLLFESRRCFNVFPGSFAPRPRVMSTVLAVSPAESPLQAQGDEFYRFARLCFSERRKTLYNNLFPRHGATALQAAFADAAIPAQARAEQLPLRTFHEIFLALSASTGP